MKRLITICPIVLFVVGSVFATSGGGGGGGDHVTTKDSVIGPVDDSVIVGRNNHGIVAGGDVTDVDIQGGIHVKGGDNINKNTNILCNKNTNLNKAVATAFSCSNADAQSNSSANISFDNKNPVQGQPVVPMDLMPRILSEERKEDMWNGKFRPPLTGYYTFEELKQRRKNEGNHKVEAGVEKDWFGKIKSPYNQSTGLIVVEGGSFDKILDAGYEYIRTFNAHAGNNVLEDECNYQLLVDAAKYGAHLVVFESSLKSVANSKGIQFGGNGVHAEASGSLTGGGGIGSTYALWVGEPQSKVALFRKLPNDDGNIPSIEDQAKEILKKYKSKKPIAEKTSKPAEPPVSKLDFKQLVQIANFWLES